MSTDKSYFDKLIAINVKSKVEKKGNLDYLSWANAWAYLKIEHSDAQRNVYESPETGLNWFTDGVTGYVKVGIVVNNIEHIDYLPIKDFRNKSITVDKLTSMDVNTAIQRATAKAIAMHGLGLSLYAGEDLVETSNITANPPKAEKVKTLITLDIGDTNWVKVLKYVSANKKLGLEAIASNLSTKYNMKAVVKKEIAKAIKDN